MMDICRICLTDAPGFDIQQLRSSEKHGNISCLQMLQFCLGLQPKPDEKITKKICTKCMDQLLKFFHFKSMALQNDTILKSVSPTINNTKRSGHWKKLDNATEYTVGNTVITKLESPGDMNKCLKENINSEDAIKIILMKESKNGDEDGNSDDFHGYFDSFSYSEKKQRRRVKRKANVNEQRIKIGMCIDCSTGFYTKSDLEEHKCPLNPESPALCKICDVTFANEANLRRHNHQRHEGSSNRFVCHLCPKGFYHLSMLKSHLRSHMNKRPFKCAKCDVAFIHKSNLKRHMESHNAPEDFVHCDICKRQFSSKRYLLRHMAVHDHSLRPKKTHECSSCGMKFTSPYARKKHELRRSHSSRLDYLKTVANDPFTKDHVQIQFVKG